MFCRRGRPGLLLVAALGPGCILERNPEFSEGMDTSSPGSDSGDISEACTPCGERVCVEGACVEPRSCLDFQGDPARETGVHTVDPDGSAGPTPPFDVYCDMDVDGGGWTLILKATNRDLDLAYDSPLWTSMELLNETSGLPNAMPLGASAKFPAYNHVEGRELRLEWFTPRLSNHDFTFVLEQSVSALLHFAGPEKILVGTETNGCNGPLLMEAPGYLDTMRIGMGRQFFGINGTDGASGRIRLGFGSNDEPDTEWRPHYGIGTGESSVQWSDQSECENNCGCMGSDGDDASADLSVNLWIR